MKITVEFDSEEEFKARIKNPRKGGGTDDGDQTGGQGTQAPAPLAPPQTQQPFNPAAPPTFTPPQGFPSATAIGPVVDPVVAGLVQRIATRIDSALASGQPADSVLTWFRGQCGAEAAAATMDQIKTVFLPKLAVPGLENIAKLMNA
jgi:hypothetical protein